MRSQDVLPVVISIAVIIAVAILQRQSKLVAAIAATMPLSAPLALWVVYAAVDGDRSSMQDFSQGMLFGVVPTLGFLVAVWLAARAGAKLVPMLAVGYGVWAVGLAIVTAVRRLVGL